MSLVWGRDVVGEMFSPIRRSMLNSAGNSSRARFAALGAELPFVSLGPCWRLLDGERALLAETSPETNGRSGIRTILRVPVGRVECTGGRCGGHEVGDPQIGSLLTLLRLRHVSPDSRC